MTKHHVMAICSHEVGTNIPGSWDRCCECILDVWVSFSTRKALQPDYSDIELKIYCLECGMRILKRDNPIIMPLTTEQLAEIEREI